MTTPIESLIDALEQRKAEQIKVVSIDFVLNQIYRHRDFYGQEAIISEIKASPL